MITILLAALAAMMKDSCWLFSIGCELGNDAAERIRLCDR